MLTLRRLAAPLAFVLALAFAGEALEVVCLDEECSPRGKGTHEQAPDDGGDHGDADGASSCLCHASFAPTDAFPQAGHVLTARSVLHAPHARSAIEPVRLVLVPPPLG